MASPSLDYSKELFASIQFLSGELVQNHLEKEYMKMTDEINQKELDEQRKDNKKDHGNNTIEENNISSQHHPSSDIRSPNHNSKNNVNDISDNKSRDNSILSSVNNINSINSNSNKTKQRSISVISMSTNYNHSKRLSIQNQNQNQVKTIKQEEKNTSAHSLDEKEEVDIFDEKFDTEKTTTVKLYEKSIKMYKQAQKIDEKKRMKSIQKKERDEEKEMRQCTFSPRINQRSREIINESSKYSQPLYERSVSTYNVLQTKKMIEMKVNENKKLQNDMKYRTNNPKKMTRTEINDFIIKQFEWKKRVDINKKAKEIALELEEKSMVKNSRDKLKQNRLFTQELSTSYTSLYSRLHLEHELCNKRKKELAKTLEPPWKPIINSPRSTIYINKRNRLNHSRSQMLNSYAYMSNNNDMFNCSQQIFNKSQYQTNKTTINFSRRKFLQSNIKARNNQDLLHMKSINSSNYQSTPVFVQKHQPVNINWEFEANSSGFNYDTFNKKKKETKYKTNDINTNYDSKISNNIEEPSWCNELEKASLYRVKSSLNASEKDLLTHKLYKLNIANLSSNGMCSSQTFIGTKGVFDNLFKSH